MTYFFVSLFFFHDDRPQHFMQISSLEDILHITVCKLSKAPPFLRETTLAEYNLPPWNMNPFSIGLPLKENLLPVGAKLGANSFL